MFDLKAALIAVVGYLRRHPEEILRYLRNATRLKFGIPVVALQWLATELESSSASGPKSVEIRPSPPGLRVLATIEQMGTLLRASCVVVVERVDFSDEQARLELRLEDVALSLLDESVQTPLAALVRSGTLDLSRVASLVAYLPSRPAALVEAVDNRLVLDLLKLPNGPMMRQPGALWDICHPYWPLIRSKPMPSTLTLRFVHCLGAFQACSGVS